MNDLKNKIHSSLLTYFPDELINIVHQNVANKPIKGVFNSTFEDKIQPLFIATYQNVSNEENLFILSNNNYNPNLIQYNSAMKTIDRKQSFKVSHAGGVAVNQHKNHLYVADNKKIHTIDIHSGKTIHTYESKYQLIGLCYNSEFDSIIVGENSNNRIAILDSCSMSAKYSNKQKVNLHFPWGIKTSPLSNKIYIADNGNERIVVCDIEGTFDPISTKNFLKLSNNPEDIAIHPYENKNGDLVEEFIITVGYGIDVFRDDQIITIGKYGSGEYEFYNAHGVEWCDGTQKLIVCDTNNRRLQFYT